ncbi:MAG: prepilin-type N-terminal cleavage/methylation domain-containing protein [Marinobacter nauticus]|uniref:type II secretion system protein n=1 Tax=Marinobacter nauticus TaxID=2743 RepID=UPI001A9062A3|nr:type II secretion system protein [Marinobacter nauticus]MBN8241242.1 type II secretion system protein [Marinobacter nauticus]
MKRFNALRSARSRQHQVAGFTLIELLVVLSIVALMASLATPVVYKSIVRAKESALKETLQVSRSALDDFYSDRGQYPSSLSELVEGKYLRSEPYDPIVESSTEWLLEQSYEQQGIVDISSASNEEALDGSLYSEW